MNKYTKQPWPSNKAPLPYVRVPWYPIKQMTKLKEASEVIQNNWTEIRAKLSHKWVDFTDRDIAQLRAKAEDLCHLLQKKYLYTKERAEEEIVKFLIEHGWYKKQ